MERDTLKIGARHVDETRAIGRDLLEKSLHMRCVAYLSHNKAKLLTETIFEVDDSRKALRAGNTSLADLNAELERQQIVMTEQREELEERGKELASVNMRLQEADRLKTVFLASMSHELRTPLNSIIGFTGILLQGMAGEVNEEQGRQLTMVKESAAHLLSLINDILDISRIEAGEVELSITEFPLEELVGEVVEIITPAGREVGLEIVTEILSPVTLHSDRRRVKQILVNLAANAVKFTGEGSITIAAKVVEGGRVEIGVRDTGAGIREGDMGRLFQPFQQVDTSLARRSEGTGLGLYLSRKLAALLHGDIRVESVYGVGSVFTVALPLRIEEMEGR